LNAGNPTQGIPEHWHFVSFGLSDLYGDGRIHVIDSSPDPVSGHGFELTLRLVKTSDNPPSWPANLMQSLAKYVFNSKNRICPGDHIPWNKSLDSSNPDSKIQHMLIADDPQLEKIRTPLGSITFCQIVGVTAEEVEQASRYNGKAVLNLLRKDPRIGGPWLITDLSRPHSVFDLFPQTINMLEADLEREGSDLAGVEIEFFYRELPKVAIKTSLCLTMSGSSDFTRGLGRLDIRNSGDNNHSFHSSSPFVGLNFLHRRVNLEGLEFTFSPENSKFLKLAFKDRLRLGRHFTFQRFD
jgi:suppressor of fused-like protein